VRFRLSPVPGKARRFDGWGAIPARRALRPDFNITIKDCKSITFNYCVYLRL
jgi:hypothetical protein